MIRVNSDNCFLFVAGEHRADVLPSRTQGFGRTRPLAESGRKDYALEILEANGKTLSQINSEGGKEGGAYEKVWVV